VKGDDAVAVDFSLGPGAEEVGEIIGSGSEEVKVVRGRSGGTLLTIFTNIFAASLKDDIIVLCHDRRDWMHPERFIM